MRYSPGSAHDSLGMNLGLLILMVGVRLVQKCACKVLEDRFLCFFFLNHSFLSSTMDVCMR